MKKALGLAMLLLVSIGTSFAMLAGKLTEEQKSLLGKSGWYKIEDYSDKVKKFKELTGKVSVIEVKTLEAMYLKLKNNFNVFIKNKQLVIDMKAEIAFLKQLKGDKLDQFLHKEKLEKEGDLEWLIKHTKEAIVTQETKAKSIKSKSDKIGIENIEKVIRNAEAKLEAIWDPKHINLVFGILSNLLGKYMDKLKLREMLFEDFYTAVKDFTDKVSVKDIKLLEAMSNYLEDKGRKAYSTKKAIQKAKYKLERIWGLKKITHEEIEEMTLKK